MCLRGLSALIQIKLQDSSISFVDTGFSAQTGALFLWVSSIQVGSIDGGWLQSPSLTFHSLSLIIQPPPTTAQPVHTLYRFQLFPQEHWGILCKLPPVLTSPLEFHLVGCTSGTAAAWLSWLFSAEGSSWTFFSTFH